jgi:hypothetical protein
MQSEGRRLRRVSFFEKDLPPVQIDMGSDGKTNGVSGTIRDLSSTGIGIRVLASELPMKLEDIGVKRRCRIRMEIASSHNTVNGIIHRSHNESLNGKPYVFLGIEFEKTPPKAGRIVHLHRHAQPLVHSFDRLKKDEKIVLRMVGISSDRIVLKTSKSNRTMVPGQLLTLTIAIPGLMNESIEGRVEDIEFAGARDSEYALHLFVMKRNRKVIKQIAEYFVSFAEGTDGPAKKAIAWSPTIQPGIVRSLRQRLLYRARGFMRRVFKTA